MRSFLDKCRHAIMRCGRSAAVVVGWILDWCAQVVNAIRPGAQQSIADDASLDAQSRSQAIRRVFLIRKLLLGILSLILCVALISIAVGAFSAASNQQGASREARNAAASQTAGASLLRSSAPQPQSSSGSAAVLTQTERDSISSQALKIAQASGKTLHQYRYCVSSKGNVSDLSGFENTVFSILNSTKGWPRAGATFSYEASSKGSGTQCDMTLILAEASTMKSFSDGCSEDYSCRVGDEVIINLDRWNSATTEWLKAGGTVARYRILVINHEVGHRLGHLDNEATCSVSGGPAPVMQQQSMSLGGCAPNEWPLDSELWIS